MSRTSIPCNEATRERLNGLRGDEYKNWDTFLNAMADAWEGTKSNGINADELESIQAGVDTIEERTDHIQRQLEDMQR